MFQKQKTFLIQLVLVALISSCTKGGISALLRDRNSLKDSSIAFIQEPNSKLGGPLSNLPTLEITFSSTHSGKFFLYEDSTLIKTGKVSDRAQNTISVAANELTASDGSKPLVLVVKKNSIQIGRLAFDVEVDTTPPLILSNLTSVY